MTRCPTCGRPGYCPACGQSRPSRQYNRPPAGRASDEATLFGPYGIIAAVIAVSLFWPVMVWHGEGGPTGNDWRWDIHSTIAESIYLGIIGIIVLLAWADRRAQKPRTAAPPRGQRVKAGSRPVPPPPPARPACRHEARVPVNNILTGELEAWLCLNPDCGAQLAPGPRAGGLKPDSSWPAAWRRG